MIKILFFIEKFGGGGAEKVLRDLVNHMDQSCFDITVQSVWPYEEGKQLVPGVKYKSVYPARNQITEKLYRIEAAAKLTYPLHIQDDYDIECAFLESGPTKIISSSTNKKSKKIAWVHCDLSRAVTDYEAFASQTTPWYQKSDRVVCVSKTVKDSFDQIFCSAFRTDVLYNVVEDEDIRKKADEPIPIQKRKVTILAVGTIYPPKNYPRLIQTHEKLLQEGIEHDLWILGDGDQRPQIEQMIKNRNLQDSVTLFGFQENPYPYMKVADIVVCSSIYEGFSTVITESAILGKAIVTTDCSGMKEILGDSQYGLITENTDEGFFEGVKLMLTDEGLRNEYAMRALHRGKNFSMKELVTQVQNYLRGDLQCVGINILGVCPGQK